MKDSTVKNLLLPCSFAVDKSALELGGQVEIKVNNEKTSERTYPTDSKDEKVCDKDERPLINSSGNIFICIPLRVEEHHNTTSSTNLPTWRTGQLTPC